MNDKKRVINRVYIVETDDFLDRSIVKICSTRELAEHYKRLLEPKYWEAFEMELTITEYPIVHFKYETLKISEEQYMVIVEENLKELEKLNNLEHLLEE